MGSAVVARLGGVRVTEVDDGLVILRHNGGRTSTHRLSGAAAMVYELADGATTVDDIAARAEARFGDGLAATSEVQRCVDELMAQDLIRASVTDPQHRPVRVLAFTPSRNRPFLLRHSIMQMQSQSYSVDHAIYVNSDEDHASLYDDLMDDRLFIRHGPPGAQHENHVRAIEAAPVGCYDLFCKIDDDDIYRLNYIEAVVSDFRRCHWDFSGAAAVGLVNGAHWHPHMIWSGFGLSEYWDEMGAIDIISGTMAFSARAMQLILDLTRQPIPPEIDWDPRTDFEDFGWLRVMARSGLPQGVRRYSNYSVHVHGWNTATGRVFTYDES